MKGQCGNIFTRSVFRLGIWSSVFCITTDKYSPTMGSNDADYVFAFQETSSSMYRLSWPYETYLHSI